MWVALETRLVFIAVCCLLTTSLHSKSWSDTDGIDSNIQARMALIGIRAVKKLVRGATKGESGTKIRQFTKYGSYDKALKDFEGVFPENVKTFRDPDGIRIVQGTVGDRLLILKPGNKTSRQASIEVKKIRELSGAESGRTTERIVYF